MVSQLLVAYVRDRLNHGYSAGEVKQSFINRGWRESDVDAAIQVALGNQPARQAQPVSRPIQHATSQAPSYPSRSAERTLANTPSSYSTVDSARLGRIVAGLVGMLLFIGISYVLFFQGPSSTRFEIKVLSGEKPLDGAEVRVYDGAKLIGTAKSVKGVAVFSNLPPKLLTFKINKDGYEEIEENYDTRSSQAATTEILASEPTPTPTPTPTPIAVFVAAPVISNVSLNVTNVTAVFKWSTDIPSNSTILYGLVISYNQSAGLNDNVTSHSVTLSGLVLNKTYYYKVLSCAVATGSSNCSSSIGSFVTALQVLVYTCSGTPIGACISGTPDKCIADPYAGAVPYPSCSTCGCPSGKTCNTVTGVCTTATATPTATPTPAPGCTVGANCGTTSCASGYTGSCSQTYSSSCVCQSCTPTCTLQAPSISGLSAGSITDTTAIISWTTNHNSNSTVYYGTATSYGSVAQLSDNVTSHSLALGSLVAGTQYHFLAQSCNSAGCSNSSDTTFITTGTSTLNYISISPVSPNANVTNGSQIQFSSVAYYSNGSTPTITGSASWSTTPGSAGAIGASTGTFIALNAVGQETVQASFGGKTNSTTVNVQKQVYTFLSFSPSASVGWGTSTTATCTASEGQAPTLTRNSANVSSPDAATLAAGSYAYVCAFAQTQNYVGYTNSSTLTVVPKPLTCSLSLSPSTGANGTSVTATSSTNESVSPVLSAPSWCIVSGTSCTGNADNATSPSFTASVAAGNYSGCSNTTSFTFT